METHIDALAAGRTGIKAAPLSMDKSGLELVENELANILSSCSESMYPILKHILTSGGKRMRPLLTIKSAQCFNPRIEHRLVKTAVAFELIHMASLVHDDIIDDSNMRHGKPTVNHIIGKQSSVLYGDYLFSKAFELLNSERLYDCLNEAIHTIEDMCDGEIEQYQHKFDTGIKIDHYYKRIYKKTACLIASCCKCGAIISCASDRNIELMENYGENIGFAFQITDDILDITGNEYLLGKPTNQDMIQGEVTLPVILLRQNHKYSQLVDQTLKPGCRRETIKSVVGALNTTNAIKKSYDIAELHIEKAKSCLELIPDSRYRETLNNIASSILDRLS